MAADIHLYVERCKPFGSWESVENWAQKFDWRKVLDLRLAREAAGNDMQKFQEFLARRWIDHYGGESCISAAGKRSLERIAQRLADVEAGIKPEDERLPPDVPREQRFYDNRNTILFSILGWTRHGNGSVDDVFPPIVPPRGLPEDCDPRIKEQSESWNGDGHSRSYFTVRELLNFYWDQVPYTKGKGKGKGKRIWSTFGDLYSIDWIISRLQEYGPPEDVRIVFWFDN